MEKSIQFLIDSTKRLLRRGAYIHLAKIIDKTHVADLAILFRSISLDHQIKLFNMIKTRELKGELLCNLEESLYLNFVNNLEEDELVKIFETLHSDQVADLIYNFDSEKSDRILNKMKDKDSKEVEDLLQYEDDSAGRVMSTDFIAIKEDMTSKKIIEIIQNEYSAVGSAFYIYVVDDYDKLVGVCSLRQLVMEKPDTKIKNFMSTEIFFVRPDTDQEDVAKIVDKYNLLAVPVVDESNKLLGIITVDDVIDIFREEATEDMLKMAGVGEEYIETKNILQNTKIRLPWLFASFIGGLIASLVIGYFGATLVRFAFLASFIPIIMGLGGNVGIQSSTIVVRGLATNNINIGDLWKVVSKELIIGLFLGAIFGPAIGCIAQLQYDKVFLAISVGTAVACSVCVAAFMGALVPLLLAKIKIDPAVAAGPFITPFVDIISVFIYFLIATKMLPIA